MAETGPTGDPGPVEAAYRRWVAALGPLSERQHADVELLYVTAARLDAARHGGESGSGVAALSREARQLAAGLRDVAVAVPEPAQSTVDSVDQVAQKRAARRRAAQSGGTP